MKNHPTTGNRRGRSRRRVVGVFITAALLGCLDTPATSAHPAPARSIAALTADDPETSGTGTDAPLVQSLTSETSSVYQLDDGRYRVEAYGAQVNYLDQGVWKAVDNSLISVPGETIAAKNAANDFTLRVPEDAGSAPVSVTSGSHRISFAMAGLDGSPSITETTATYTDVEGASEVVYEPVPEGVKESIVLDAAPSHPVSYVFDLRLSRGLTPSRHGSGEIDIRDSSGKRIFRLPAPFMFDSAVAPGQSTDIVTELEATDDGWSLSLAPNLQWLQDPRRVYPVVVDPTIVEPSSINDARINESNPTSGNYDSDYLTVGGPSGARRRALVRFSLDHLPADAVIESAKLKLYLDASQTTGSGQGDFVARRTVSSQSWGPGVTWKDRDTSIPWATPGAVWADSTMEPVVMNGATSGYKAFDVTPMVVSWVAGLENNGFVVRKQGDGTNRVLSFYSNNSADPTKMPRLDVGGPEVGDTGLESRRWRVAACGAVWSMVVVVDVPDLECC